MVLRVAFRSDSNCFHRRKTGSSSGSVAPARLSRVFASHASNSALKTGSAVTDAPCAISAHDTTLTKTSSSLAWKNASSFRDLPFRRSNDRQSVSMR
jgi:hypothetical protein